MGVKCPFCPYEARHNNVVQLHIRRRHLKEKPFKCPELNCPASFTDNNNLKTHQLVHRKHDESLKKFKCSVCDFKTIRKQSLTVHLKIHSDFKEFGCDLCPSRFKTKGDLQKHEKNVHSTLKPFKCPHPNCEYAAKTSSHVKQHLKTHSTVKDIKCPIPNCGYEAKIEYNLRRHMMVHDDGEKRFKCTFCAYSTHHSDALVSHVRTHMGETPYSCQLCPYKTTRNCHLSKHMKQHPVG